MAEPRDNYLCYISRYGSGGTYYIPNTICIRTILENETDLKRANEVIAHEIVHLSIYDQIKFNNISFENTERLVDLILTKTPIGKLINNPSFQNFGDKRLDKIFLDGSFDIVKTIKEFKIILK